MISIIFLSNLLPLQGGNPLPLFSSEYLLPHRKPDAPLSASLTQHMNHCIRKCLKIPIFPIAGFPRPPWFIRSLPSTDISIITETTGKYNSKNASLLTVYFSVLSFYSKPHYNFYPDTLLLSRNIRFPGNLSGNSQRLQTAVTVFLLSSLHSCGAITLAGRAAPHSTP